MCLHACLYVCVCILKCLHVMSHTPGSLSVCVYLYVYMCMSVCMCVCICLHVHVCRLSKWRVIHVKHTVSSQVTLLYLFKPTKFSSRNRRETHRRGEASFGDLVTSRTPTLWWWSHSHAHMGSTNRIQRVIKKGGYESMRVHVGIQEDLEGNIRVRRLMIQINV